MEIFMVQKLKLFVSGKVFSLPELKAHLSFSDCLLFIHLSEKFSHFHHPLQNLWGRFNQILTKCTCIFAILFLSPIKKGKIFYLNKLESPSLKDALSQVWHAHWPNLKIFSSRTTGSISTKLDSKHFLWRGFKLIQMKGQTLF